MNSRLKYKIETGSLLLDSTDVFEIEVDGKDYGALKIESICPYAIKIIFRTGGKNNDVVGKSLPIFKQSVICIKRYTEDYNTIDHVRLLTGRVVSSFEVEKDSGLTYQHLSVFGLLVMDQNACGTVIRCAKDL